MRKTIFANEEIYHVFNLGVERRPVFMDKREYDRGLLTLNFYRFENLSAGLAQVLSVKVTSSPDLETLSKDLANSIYIAETRQRWLEIKKLQQNTI